MNDLRFPRGLYGVTPEWADADKLDHAVRAAARGATTKTLCARTGQADRRALSPSRQLGLGDPARA